MKKENNYNLEKFIISLRAVTYLMMFFVVGYTIKLTMTLQFAFINVVHLEWLRFAGAFLISFVLATGLLIVSIHKHEQKWLPVLFGCMDVITLVMVFSSGAETEHFNLWDFSFNAYIPTFKEGFFSVLIALVGFHLVSVFTQLMIVLEDETKQSFSELLQESSELKQDISELKQGKSEQERKLSGVLAGLKHSISEQEQIISKRIAGKEQELKDYEKRTCEKCFSVFKSINGLNAHKSRCKEI